MRLFELVLGALLICSAAGAAPTHMGVITLKGSDADELARALTVNSSDAVHKVAQTDTMVLKTAGGIRCSTVSVTHRSECRIFPGRSLANLYPKLSDALHPEEILKSAVTLRGRSASHLTLGMANVAIQSKALVQVGNWMNLDNSSIAYSVGQSIGVDMDADKVAVQCVVFKNKPADCRIEIRARQNPFAG